MHIGGGPNWATAVRSYGSNLLDESNGAAHGGSTSTIVNLTRTVGRLHNPAGRLAHDDTVTRRAVAA
jgi:hypothetical protein